MWYARDARMAVLWCSESISQFIRVAHADLKLGIYFKYHSFWNDKGCFFLVDSIESLFTINYLIFILFLFQDYSFQYT